MVEANLKRLMPEMQDLINVHASNRELECGMFLAFNYPPDQIALTLKLSRRTVDSYLNNLKLKCDCANKWDLRLFLQQKLGLELSSQLRLLGMHLRRKQRAASLKPVHD